MTVEKPDRLKLLADKLRAELPQDRDARLAQETAKKDLRRHEAQAASDERFRGKTNALGPGYPGLARRMLEVNRTQSVWAVVKDDGKVSEREFEGNWDEKRLNPDETAVYMKKTGPKNFDFGFSKEDTGEVDDDKVHNALSNFADVSGLKLKHNPQVTRQS